MEECDPMAFQFFIAQPQDCVSVFSPSGKERDIDFCSIRLAEAYSPLYSNNVSSSAAVNAPIRRRDCSSGSTACSECYPYYAWPFCLLEWKNTGKERYLLTESSSTKSSRKYRFAWRSLSPLHSLNASLQISAIHVCLRYRLKINLYIGKYRSLLRWLELTFETIFRWRKLDSKLYLLRSVPTNDSRYIE